MIKLFVRLASIGAVWFGLIFVLYILSMSQIGWCRNAEELVATDGACGAAPGWFWFAIILPYLLLCGWLARRSLKRPK